MIKRLLTVNIIVFLLILISNVYCPYSAAAEQEEIADNKQVTEDTNTKLSERRNYIRFNNKTIQTPIDFKCGNGINLIDISRKGIALEHNNKLTTGDIVPVVIKYKDIEINTSAEIIYADKKHASAKFIPQDKAVLNDLLYLSIQLEFDNGLLVTRLKEG